MTPKPRNALRTALELLRAQEKGDDDELVRRTEALLQDARADAADDDLFARVVRKLVDRDAGRPDAWTEERAGVTIRQVWNERSFLIHCAAGVAIPGHTHAREERLMILDGEIRIGAERHATGACLISPQGSRHDTAQTLSDCLLLVQFGAEEDPA